MNEELTLKILREIAEPGSGAIFSRREAARSAADLIEQQAARLTALESERDALLAAAGKEAVAADAQRMTEIARKWIKEGSEASPEFYWGDFYDCVREIIAAGDGRDAWQPIDTAPKDGRMFLGWVDAVRYGESDEGVQFETNVSEHDFCRWHEHHGYFENMMGQIGDAYHVTHWQPLPAPPAALSQKAGEQQ